MKNVINVRNGEIVKNELIEDQYEINFNKFRDGEELFTIEYGDYLINVIYYQIRMFIVKIEKWGKPVVEQEVGDYESLIFTLQNYIDLLASFKENNVKIK